MDYNRYYKKIQPVKSSTNRRNTVDSVIDDFSSVNKALLVNDGDPTMLGTAIPYLFNLYSDLILNPCTISTSELQKMVYTMPVLACGLSIITNLVINEIKTYNHLNKQYADFINEMIKKMDRPLSIIIKDMLTMLWAGYYVGEKKLVTVGRYTYVQDIQPRPAQSILFRVDSQGQLKDDGIIQYYFNNLWTGYGNLLAYNQVGPDGSQIPNPYAPVGDLDFPLRTVWAQPIGTVVIPKDKCIHITYRGLDGMDNPYGRPLIRPAYNAYLARAALDKINLNKARMNGSAIPVITVSPNQTKTAEGLAAFDDLQNQLENMGNNEDAPNPYLLLLAEYQKSVWVDTLNSTANLDQFINMSKYYDQQQILTLLFQSDLMGLSDKGSQALGETQNDLVGRNISAVVDSVKDTLIQQMVKPILQINFNEQEDFGSFDNIDNVSEDVALNMDKLNMFRAEGKKLKTEAIFNMMDVNIEALESEFDPQELNTNSDFNSETISNFKRSKSL